VTRRDQNEGIKSGLNCDDLRPLKLELTNIWSIWLHARADILLGHITFRLIHRLCVYLSFITAFL